MKNPTARSFAERFGYGPFFVVTVLPVLLLFVGILPHFSELTAGGRLFDLGREIQLLARTLLYATGVALTVCLAGFLTAIYILGPGQRQIRRLSVLLLVALTIPSCVHAMGWLKWLTVLRRIGLPGVTGRGWLVSWLVQSMALLPLGLLIIAGGVLVQDREQFLAARLLGPDNRFLWRLLPGLLRPQLLTAGAIVWILTLNDYAIPSIFSVNTYAIEVFVEYSSSGSLARTVVKSLPLVLLQTGVLTFVLGQIPQIFLSGRLQDFSTIRFHFPRPTAALAALGPVLAVLQAAIPLSVIFLSQAMWQQLLPTLAQSLPDYAGSLAICALAIVIGSPLAFWAARWIQARGVSRPALFGVIFPAALPGTLTGVALIHLFNHPETNGLYNSLLLPALAVLGRFLPFAALLMLAWLKRTDRQLIQAAQLLEPRERRTTWHILLPLLAPGIIMGASLIFLLGIGELAATVLTVPPGYSTLTIRLYNYLHYGATDSVLGLSLLIILTIALVAAAVGLVSRRHHS